MPCRWEYGFDFFQFTTHALPATRRRTEKCFVRRRAWVSEDLLQARWLKLESGQAPTHLLATAALVKDENGRLYQSRVSDLTVGTPSPPTARQIGSLQHAVSATASVRDPAEIAFVPHQFSSKTFTAPTYCAVCRGLLVGIMKQGKSCKECRIHVHKGCVLKAHQHCPCRKMQQ